MHGYRAIPEQFARPVAAVAGETFLYTGYSLNSVTAATVRLATEVTRRNRGRVERGDVLVIRAQVAEPVVLPDFPEVGVPAERVGCDEARWRFGGEWRRVVTRNGKAERVASTRPVAITKGSTSGTDSGSQRSDSIRTVTSRRSSNAVSSRHRPPREASPGR